MKVTTNLAFLASTFFTLTSHTTATAVSDPEVARLYNALQVRGVPVEALGAVHDLIARQLATVTVTQNICSTEPPIPVTPLPTPTPAIPTTVVPSVPATSGIPPSSGIPAGTPTPTTVETTSVVVPPTAPSTEASSSAVSPPTSTTPAGSSTSGIVTSTETTSVHSSSVSHSASASIPPLAPNAAGKVTVNMGVVILAALAAFY